MAIDPATRVEERTTAASDGLSRDEVSLELVAFLEQKTGTPWTADREIFGSGAVTSLLAMELVLHLERQFGVVVSGPDLTLDNFGSVETITDLVLRLRTPGR